MEGSADVALVGNQHRLVVGFPYRIPVLLLRFRNLVTHLHIIVVLREHLCDGRFVVVIFLDVGEQGVFIFPVHKTVATGIAQ